MKIIVCIDERGGMAFNKRRQSSDVRVTEDILRTAAGRLTVYPYSEKLFSAIGGDTVQVSDTALDDGGDGYVFVEDRDVKGYISSADGLIIYSWNRHYPADLRLGFKPGEEGMRLTWRTEFVGNSHERITKEIYER